ncbi:DNA-binding related protein [Herbaspirillum rubrisubalbicans M1]|uniref:ComEA family DNA-binding protein n=1 Tax=Herbaspirillum rubrisubalbicans TaxID=80842 RepID=UPI00073A15C1|nr:helix-hairpin-helix domain-containing protein [Herbaspirillum rubrisubalbicans]ALU90808.1 DNA-binding related protein [Herbaspirillum rubrisubalbicans M1]
MLKHTLLFILSFFVATGLAWAEVDVNKADQAALDGVRGIGPALSRRILEARTKEGAFKSWDDLEKRVKGIKDKSAVRLSTNGLTVNGQSRSADAAATPAASSAKSAKSPKTPRSESQDKQTAAPPAKGEQPAAAGK